MSTVTKRAKKLKREVEHYFVERENLTRWCPFRDTPCNEFCQAYSENTRSCRIVDSLVNIAIILAEMRITHSKIQQDIRKIKEGWKIK